MSFPKAPVKRFNEAASCAPPPGSYNIKSPDPSKGPVSFEKSQRFRIQMEDVEVQQNLINMKPMPSPAITRKLQSLTSRPNNAGIKSDKDPTSIKEKQKQKELEKEIRKLIGELGQQDKRMQVLEEDLVKYESKLSASVREKNTLKTNNASLEKQLLELRRRNEFLKTKYFEDGTQKKMHNIYVELMKLKNQINSKKKGFIKKEDMETKLNIVQETVEEKLVQPEEIAERQSQAEETYDLAKILECIAELGNIGEQMDKYKMDIVKLEKIIESKNEVIERTLQLKETMMSTQLDELNEKCKIFEEQKEKYLSEYGAKEQALNAEIRCLREKLSIEEQEQQKQKEIFKETSAGMHQKLLQLQQEIAKEREFLESELKEAVGELDKLHTKEARIEKLLKHLEQENQSQTKEIAQLELTLKRKNTELEEMAKSHKNDIGNLQEEYSQLQYKLGETTAEFEAYKVCVAEDKAASQNKLTEMNRTIQNMTHALQGEQQVKDTAMEDSLRMIFDAESKVALKDAEIKRIRESSSVQIATLQAKLDEQREDLNQQFEVERKIITEKLEADYKENIKMWRDLYERLYNKVKPFQQQLDAYEAEKNALLNEHGLAQEELNKINDAYAKLLGHQNQKQKIKHVIKLKDDNTQLKQEVLKLRAQLSKEKQAQGELQDQMNKIQGIRRFDPAKAFQHSSKENVPPKTPFKESNRNKNQAPIC